MNFLRFMSAVISSTNKRNIEFWESPWQTTQKSYKSLYVKYCKENTEHQVSYGSFLALKPFYVRGVKTNDIEMCCCKTHLHARWSIKALQELVDTHNKKQVKHF